MAQLQPLMTRPLSITSRCWSSVSFGFLKEGHTGALISRSRQYLCQPFSLRHLATEANLKVYIQINVADISTRKLRVFETASREYAEMLNLIRFVSRDSLSVRGTLPIG